MDADTKFQTFEDLEVYKAARQLRTGMYEVTRRLPDFERYELASQIRRAAVSLTNNIAEGHGRFHYLDQIKFMLQARGSLQELIDDLNICVDEKYLTTQEIAPLRILALQVSKQLGGYIRYLRKCKAGENLILKESPVEYGVRDDLPSDATMQPFTM